MNKKLLISLGVTTSILLAQKITSIEYEGLSHLSKQMAQEISGVHIGDEIDSSSIDDSILKLYNQGYFEDVWVDKGSHGRLIYHFKEKPSIANVQIDGFGDDGLGILNSLGIKRGGLYDAESIKEAKDKLMSVLQAKGNYDSIVDAKVTPVGDKKQAVSVVFDVNKGQKIKIEDVNFNGAKSLDKSQIEDGLVNKEAGWMEYLPFLGKGEVKVDQLEYDAYRIKENYMNNGYLDAKVSKPLMKVDYSNYTASIDYNIDEGLQYKVGSLSITPAIKGLNISELQSNLRLKQGRVFSIKKMRQDITNIKNAVGDLGYAFAKVVPHINKHIIDCNFTTKWYCKCTV